MRARGLRVGAPLSGPDESRCPGVGPPSASGSLQNQNFPGPLCFADLFSSFSFYLFPFLLPLLFLLSVKTNRCSLLIYFLKGRVPILAPSLPQSLLPEAATVTVRCNCSPLLSPLCWWHPDQPWLFPAAPPGHHLMHFNIYLVPTVYLVLVMLGIREKALFLTMTLEGPTGHCLDT